MPLFTLGSIINSFKQKNLENTRNKNQIAHALRQYKLANTWPLDTAPEDIAQSIEEMPGNTPIYLIIAPVAKESEFQKALGDMWGEIFNFFTSTFSVNSDAPVIIGKYTDKSAPAHDYMTIFNGLKSLPTLYLAPFSTMKDSILGISIAFWGTDDTQNLPVVQNIELDTRRLYVDEIREETADFVRRCEQGMLDAQDYPQLVNNAKIFAAERKMLEKGNDFAYLDKNLAFYKELVPSASTYISLMKKIIPVIKLLSSFIIDTYFVIKYNSIPRFPAIACAVAQNDALPAFEMRGVIDGDDKFSLYQGRQFLNDIFLSYADIIARNTPPAAGVRYIPHFRTSFSDSPSYYEDVLAERYLLETTVPSEYSSEQNQVMVQLSVMPENNVPVKFTPLLAEWKRITAATLERADTVLESPEEKYERAKLCLQGKDVAKGIELLKEVAAVIPQAAHDLGKIYYDGTLCPKNFSLAAQYYGIAYHGGHKNYVRLAMSKKESGASQSEYRNILYEGMNSGDDSSACKLAWEYVKDREFLTAKNILAGPIKNGSQEAYKLFKEITMNSIGGLFGKSRDASDEERGGFFSRWRKKK